MFLLVPLSDPTREPSIWGRAADPDEDGLANLAEYFADRDPLRAELTPWLTATVAEGRLWLTFRQAKLAADVTAVVEGTDDLQSWSPDAILAEPARDLGEAWEWRFSLPWSPSGPRFIRVRLRWDGPP